MKTITMTVITALILAGSSVHGQNKIWSWSPKQNADARSLHLSAVAENGSGAFIIGETKIESTFVSDDYNGPNGPSWYLIVWVDSRGRTILSKRISTTDDFFVVQRIHGGSKWMMGFMGLNSLGVSDGKKLRIFTVKNGKVSERQRVLPPSTSIAIFPSVGFSGWLEQDSSRSGSYSVFDPNDGSSADSPIWDIKSLSLWAP